MADLLAAGFRLRISMLGLRLAIEVGRETALRHFRSVRFEMG